MSTELCLWTGMSQLRVGSQWFKINRQTNTGNVMVDAYYRTPDQEEEPDEAFFRQLEETLHLQGLVLMGE